MSISDKDIHETLTKIREMGDGPNIVGFIAANGNGDEFRAWDAMGPTWVSEKKKAVVFLRHEDCESVFAEDEDTWKILPVTADDLK
jgi:hypothetical protein